MLYHTRHDIVSKQGVHTLDFAYRKCFFEMKNQAGIEIQ
jgi:hypothetical protein